MVYVATNCAIQVVPEFFSTTVMNFVGWYRAVCLYPGYTLSKLGIMNADTPKAKTCAEKYQGRGFGFVKAIPRDRGPTHFCREDPPCPLTIRSIHDRDTVFIPFGDMKERLSLYEGTLAWRLNNNTCGEEGLGFTIGKTGSFSKPPNNENVYLLTLSFPSFHPLSAHAKQSPVYP